MPEVVSTVGLAALSRLYITYCTAGARARKSGRIPRIFLHDDAATPAGLTVGFLLSHKPHDHDRPGNDGTENRARHQGEKKRALRVLLHPCFPAHHRMR